VPGRLRARPDDRRDRARERRQRGRAGGGASTDPDISANGSTTAFFSAATNLAGDTNTCGGFPNPGECSDIFVHVE
jgi:hypothetical protein